MGKSTLAEMVKTTGALVVDTDQIARELTVPGGDAMVEIRDSFGVGVIAEDGGLDRQAMAARVFENEAERGRLETILHPRIRDTWQKAVSAYRGKGDRWSFVVIPLLFETGSEEEFDHILCVACQRKDQEERLLERGFSAEHARLRIESQWDIEKKMRLSDWVIWTSCRQELTRIQLDWILGSLGMGNLN